MHKQTTKRREYAKRILTYCLMTMAVLVGVVVCFALVSGYGFDFKKQEIVQSALVQFQSVPNGASIEIDNQQQSFKTPGRKVVETGTHSFRLYREGYHDWNKTCAIKPAEIRWLNYVRLVPTEITTTNVLEQTKIKQMMSSPDRNFIALDVSNPRAVVIANVSDPKNIKSTTMTLSDSLLTKPKKNEKETLDMLEWDPGSRYLLVRHTVGKTTEYLELDRRGDVKPRNITKDFSLALSNPHFMGSSGQTFYTLNDGDLRRVNYGDMSVSAPLAENVTDFRVYQEANVVAFVTVKDKAQTVGLFKDGKTHTVRAYNDIQTTFVEFTHYFDKDYLAIARSDEVEVITAPLSLADATLDGSNTSNSRDSVTSPGTNSQGSSSRTPEKNSSAEAANAPIRIPLAADTAWLSLSSSGRMIAAGSGKDVTLYDQEVSQKFNYQLAGLSGAPQWLDNYYLVDPSNGRIAMIEFDGTNRNDIVSGYGAPSLSADGKYLFSLASAPGGAALQRSGLVLDN